MAGNNKSLFHAHVEKELVGSSGLEPLGSSHESPGVAFACHAPLLTGFPPRCFAHWARSAPNSHAYSGVRLVIFSLSPISHSGMVGSSGLEPPTSRLSGVRSNRLSYEPSFFPSSHLGGDERDRTADPPACKAGALPAELHPPVGLT